MEEVLPMLGRLDFVKSPRMVSRHAGQPGAGTSALFNQDGKLTKLGECYRDA